MSTVALISGGINSAVALHHQISTQGVAAAVYVNHREGVWSERSAAWKLCEASGVKLVSIPLRNAQVPKAPGGPTRDAPGLLLTMVGLAGSVAASLGAESVTLGLAYDTPLAGSAPLEFANAAGYALGASSGGALKRGAVEVPLIHYAQPEVIRRGRELGVSLEGTWSCHRIGQQHCGECDGCARRKEAFAAAHDRLSDKERATFGADPTRYA